jgi:hypothetical protein
VTKAVIGLHHDRQLARARQYAREVLGEDGMLTRERTIATLPTVTWKGRTLYTLTCRGDYGRGEHPVHLPEAVLWALIHFDAYRCAYHR